MNFNFREQVKSFVPYVCVTMLFAWKAANAEPVISDVTGQFDRGAAISIKGSGFGEKVTPGPLVWDTFETGTLGTNIKGNAPTVENKSGTWVWDDFHNGYAPSYSSDKTRPNSSRSSKHSFTPDAVYNSSLEIFHDSPNTGDEVYFSYWYYYDRTSSTWMRNFKPWMVYGTAADRPTSYVGWGQPPGDGTLRNAVIDSGETGSTLWADEGDIASVEGQWIRIEQYLKVSSPGTANGAWMTWIHQPNAADPRIALVLGSDNLITRGSTNYWEQWHFGAYHSTDSQTGTAAGNVYIDDLYFDTSKARVEICEAATWSACTHREIQVASSWTDSEVVVTLNAGSFSEGDAVYLFVVDSAGRVSQSSAPMTIGGTAVASPKPPENVSAQ